MTAAARSSSSAAPRSRALERLAILGAAICAVGLALPWYRIPFATRPERSGLTNFGFAHLALLITLGAAVALVFVGARGKRPPLPLHEGTLLAVAGGWTALICGFLVLDRPDARVGSLPADYGLAYGILITLAGAALIVLAGIRLRRIELREGPRAPGPTSASPLQSR